MATAYNFDLLDLADGESGDAAVSVVVGKKKTEAAAAKVADPTQPAVQEKPKFSYYTKLQLDTALEICKNEQEKLRLALKKLGAEEAQLKKQPGNEARLEEVCNEQQKLRLERRKLWVKERTALVPERDAFYEENGIPLPEPKPNPEDALRICLQDQKLYQVALYQLKDEETNLKGQPGNEARLKEILAEQQKLSLERIRLRVKERMTLVPERDDFYEENGIPLPELPHPDDALRICLQDQKIYKDALFKLMVEETNLKGQPGNEARLKEILAVQQKLRPEQKELWKEERRLLHEIAFIKENGNPDDADLGSNRNSVNDYSNNDGGSCDGGYDDQLGDGGDHYPQGHDESRVERGHSYYNNGDRQGYRQRQPKMTKKYIPKVKASSDTGTEAEDKPEENVVSATNTERKEASVDNAEAVPASQSDKSAGGAAQEGSKKKGPKNTLSGSEKRKKKNAKKNSSTELDKVKKQDSEVDGSTDKQPLEEEQKTLAEYEKMREEKKKTLEASKTEVRKVTAEEFKNLKVLEKKKLDDEEAVIKVEKALPKVKEASKKEEAKAEGKDAAAKDGKTKKVVPLHEILSFRQPRRFTVQEDGSSARTRFNGGFQGGSRDNSTEPRINGRAAQNEAGGHNSNGAPRGAYNGRGDGAPRGDYSGGRGNGGYGYGRGHGGNQGDAGYQQQQQHVGQYQRERAGNGGYQQQRQGGNGGYQQQRQGGNVGQYQQDRAGNGGYHQQRNGYHQQRNYPGSDRYYQQRGNSGDRRNFQRVRAPVLKDLKAFPALSALVSAQSAAATSAPAQVPAQASAPAAAAPAQAV